MAKYLFESRVGVEFFDDLRSARTAARDELQKQLEGRDEGDNYTIKIYQVRLAATLEGTVVRNVAISAIDDDKGEDDAT